MALGDHLRADQHVHFARVHLRQLRLQRPFQPRRVRVHAGDPHRFAAGTALAHQQFRQRFFQPLGAAADRGDVNIAAGRTGPRHPLGEAAVVTAQRPVDLVEDPIGAAVGAFTFPVAGGAGQYRRIAAPVQEHQRLFAAGDPVGNRRQQLRRKNRLVRLQVHVQQPDGGQLRVADPRRHLQQAIPALVAGMPAFQRWRGRSQQYLGPFQPAAIDGQIAGRVARTFLLLVARIVLLVDDDQFERGHRGEYGHPRSEHHAGGTAVPRQPAFQPLGGRHAAVHRHNVSGAEAGDEALLELRREVDLRHHHQRLRLRVRGEQALDCLQVDLGLAAAGGTEQQTAAFRAVEAGQRLLLFGGQLHGCDGSRCGRVGGRPLEATSELLGPQVAQLRRQGGQGNLAQSALVVLGREADQLPPLRRQRRDSGQHPGDRLGVLHAPRRLAGDRIPNHAQNFAPSQLHADQSPCCEWKLTSVAQGAGQRTVGWGRHDNRQFMNHEVAGLADCVEVFWRNIC